MNVDSHVLSINSSDAKFDGIKYSGSGQALNLFEIVSTPVSEVNPGQRGRKIRKSLHECAFFAMIIAAVDGRVILLNFL
ncbi:hypothetical protein N7G274_004550 [Stereocaulon virgatum]|uniref:Uncharacterized protein n=1 Tax=Stereocaulon virgatum TaxID=373712 RepID=A0ABR4ABG0_9LECA